MLFDQPVGEILPLHVIKELHVLLSNVRHRTADRLWDAAAVSAVSLFEGWRSV